VQVATPPTASEFLGGIIGITLRPVSGADFVSPITDEHLLHLDHLCSNLSKLFHPIPLPCALAFPSPSHQDATALSPCWATHFMTQERIMFSNPTPSKPRLSPAAMMIDDVPSALKPSWHCASILQPAAPPQVVAFESQTISALICLNRFTFAESRKSDPRL